MTLWQAVALIAAGLLGVGTVHAQSYPAKPIRWIVPYTPGGLTDNVTRLVTQKIQESVGQPVVVENRPGANSIIGAEIVSRATPDGYTLLTVIAAHAANATLYSGKLPFDPVKGFAPVSLVGIAPLILTATNNFPAKDVKELIEYAKKNPGKVSYGSSGIGAAAHLTSELLKQTAGIDIVHVPYKGTAPALQGLIAGDIQILIDVPSTMMTHVRGGKIKALGDVLAAAHCGCRRSADRRRSRRTGDRVVDVGDVPRTAEHAARDRTAAVGRNRESGRDARSQGPARSARHRGCRVALPSRRGSFSRPRSRNGGR